MKSGPDVGPSSHDMYTKAQKERLDNLDQANQEIDRLRKTIEKLQSELQGMYTSLSFTLAFHCLRWGSFSFARTDVIGKSLHICLSEARTLQLLQHLCTKQTVQ